MTAEVRIATQLDAPPDEIWRRMNRPATLVAVSKPMIRFTPIDPAALPEVWEERDYLCAMHLFGWLPVGRQVISISRPPPEGDRRYLRDNGHSASIRRWDHVITVAPRDGGTFYEDHLVLDAGLRTPIVATFARRFYTHRQNRWRQLVAAGFRVEGDAS